jgi:undecaprenyl-diphosphatase
VPALSPRRAAEVVTVIAALFVLCTAAVATGRLAPLDQDVAAMAAQTTGHIADVALSLDALSASVPVSAAWIALLAVLAVGRPRLRWRVAVLAAVVVAGVALEVLLKMVVDHPGPHPARTVVTLGAGGVETGAYPSGHMLRGMALACGTALLLAPRHRPAAMVIAVAYTVLLAWTRVYLNEHWASDVIGGLLVGLAAVVVVAAVPEARG